MPVTEYDRVSVTGSPRANGYWCPRTRFQNSLPLHIVSSRGSPLCSRSPLLALSLTVDPMLPSCDTASWELFPYRHINFVPSLSMPLLSLGLRFSFTAGFVLASALQLALLTFLPPLHLSGGDTCYRSLFVFMSSVARHDVDARIDWHLLK